MNYSSAAEDYGVHSTRWYSTIAHNSLKDKHYKTHDSEHNNNKSVNNRIKKHFITSYFLFLSGMTTALRLLWFRLFILNTLIAHSSSIVQRHLAVYDRTKYLPFFTWQCGNLLLCGFIVWFS